MSDGSYQEHLKKRAERAEARVAELEGLLRLALERIPTEHDFDHTPSDDAVRADILAALGKGTGRQKP